MGASSSSEEKTTTTMGRLSEDMKLYRLVDMHGGGELIPWMRYAVNTGDHSIIDGYFDTKVKDFLYKGGEGKIITVPELVKIRNKERNAMLGAFSRKKGKGKSGPNILDDFNQEGENVGDLKKALKLLDGGGGKGAKGESKYRDICWKLDERGSMGETLLGVCLLQGTAVHNQLALKLLQAFPKLINDYNISEDYYGLSPLHQAIVNEDPHMVSILLRKGADVNKRCFGAFFCSEDQRASRTDSLEHEHVDISMKTNYTGNMYFGEYPLHFAVCMNQPECYRLLLTKKANPNAQDSNGNTVVHMCVIHQNLVMLRLAVETGASYKIINKQGMTPLTLAARLAKKKMFIELLELEGESIWDYADSSQTAYPLATIDTINESNGEMNEQSALSLVVYGETSVHLDLMDGLLENILQSKWNAYAKKSWYISLISFTIYWAVFFSAFMNRPFSMTTEMLTGGLVNGSTGWTNNVSTINIIQGECYDSGKCSKYYDAFNEQQLRCHLFHYDSLPWYQGWLRLGCEVAVIFGVIVQIGLDAFDMKRIGYKKWFRVMRAFPEKILYKFSFFGVLFLIPVRVFCNISSAMLVIDNVVSTILVIMTTLHFLYYSRAIQFVGPFVLMIYTIIATDLSRFVLIYSIFMIGFSQSFYLIFTSCERAQEAQVELTGKEGEFTNVLKYPTDALIRTFIMTIGEFMVLYREMAACENPIMKWIGKMCFVIFEMCVSILQFNLLIAMMTRTYETIFQTRKEWKRQWAQVILMLELSLSPKERLAHLMRYSRPTGTNKHVRSYVVSKKIDYKADEFAKQAKIEKMELWKEEKRMLMRKRQREADRMEGRPITHWRPYTMRGSRSNVSSPTPNEKDL